MKKIVFVFLIVCIFVLASFLYKNSNTPIFYDFPQEDKASDKEEAPLFLYIFFSAKNCRDCLAIIEKLNHLPPVFKVTGVVPDRELEDEPLLRSISGAEFPLVGAKKFSRYCPHYSPSIIGVSKKGTILFSIPSAPGSIELIDKLLKDFYKKAYPLLL
jgi:hypothetical protein